MTKKQNIIVLIIAFAAAATYWQLLKAGQSLCYYSGDSWAKGLYENARELCNAGYPLSRFVLESFGVAALFFLTFSFFIKVFNRKKV